MVELFKISEGPWSRVFQGSVQGTPIELYSNPEKALLMLAYEMDNNIPKGAVMEVYKVFYSKADLNAFIETLPRDVIVLVKHQKNETMRFLVVGSSPSYVEWEEQGVLDAFEKAWKNMEVGARLLREVSKAYDVELSVLSDVPEAVRFAFFSHPLSVAALATSSPTGINMQGLGESVQVQPQGSNISSATEIMLGLTQDHALVKEPIQLFKRSLVLGSKKEDRLHAFQVLIEGALLSNIPCVILDWDNTFTHMGTPTKNTATLQGQGIDIEPIGFPYKEFTAPDQLKIDLSLVNPKGLTEALGIGGVEIQTFIEALLKENQAANLQELVGIVKRMEATPNFSAFYLNKVVRMLSLLDVSYPGLFGGHNNLDEISKNWFKSIGRASIVPLKNLDERTALMVTHSLTKGLLEYYKRQGVSGKVRTFLVIPEAARMVGASKSSTLTREIIELLDATDNSDVGFMLGADHEIDLSFKLVQKVDTRLNIISGKDCGVTISGRKTYRLELRETLSQSVVESPLPQPGVPITPNSPTPQTPAKRLF